MNTPKVSVVIPIYNVEKYIERCARSLFEQTLDDIEYIFIDDCTPDKSVDILESVLKEYPHRIPQTQIIRLPKNIGAANVRKKGILLATGEYVIQCDSDDWVEKDMYELMYNKALSEDLDMIVCDFIFYGKYRSQYIKHNDKHHIMKEILIGSIACSLCNKLIKKDIFNNDIIYPTFSMAEDLTISPQLIYFSNSIGHINKALYHYCKNPESITNANSTIKISQKTNQYIGNINLLFKFIERENILLPKYIIATIKYRCREWIVPIINTSYG